MGDLDDVVKDFLVESCENLDQLDRNLVELEKDPTAKDILSSIFRTIHTVKGTCGFLGFAKLEAVAHVGENLLSRMRDGHLALNPEIISALFALVDAVRQMLVSIEVTGQDGDTDYTVLIGILTRLQEAPDSGTPQAGNAETTTASPTPSVPAGRSAKGPAPKKKNRKAPASSAHSPEPQTSSLEAQVSSPELQTSSSGVQVSSLQTRDSNPQPVTPDSQSSERTSAVSDSTIRIDVGLLDKLMNLVGELVLARNQILQVATTKKDTAFVATTQRLNLITSELQQGVMKMRMQPVGNVLSKFPRMVRDLTVSCGKQVRVEIEGKETELDKTIIEAIKDPLTHLVRNSIDHGIESPDARLAAGKPAEGCLTMRAFHESGQVNIEIIDDGAGINFERVKQKALQRGLITPERAAHMSEREAVNLIFLPGFSTAEKVTNVSGRGVGMDVVKTNLEKIGGVVDVHSQAGYGTTFKIKIPLTLAIVPALTVTSGADRYAIPQVNVLELVRLEEGEAESSIEMIHGAPVYRLRENLLPLVYLNRELGVEDSQVDGTGHQAASIVVLRADDRRFGLVVDAVTETQEIVVKPLGKHLKSLSVFAGATIMGDGKVALILDVLGIAHHAGVVSEVQDRALGDKGLHSQEEGEDRQMLLLFQAGENSRMAMPLSLVARLEEFPCSIVEKTGNQEVVQYRGQILPLIRLSHLLRGYAADVEHDPMQVVVYSDQGRSVGVVVDRILDIVEETLTVQDRTHSEGLLGSAVIQQRVTDLLNIQSILRAVDPTFVEEPGAEEIRV